MITSYRTDERLIEESKRLFNHCLKTVRYTDAYIVNIILEMFKMYPNNKQSLSLIQIFGKMCVIINKSLI